MVGGIKQSQMEVEQDKEATQERKKELQRKREERRKKALEVEEREKDQNAKAVTKVAATSCRSLLSAWRWR